jgi:hypothetical protein
MLRVLGMFRGLGNLIFLFVAAGLIMNFRQSSSCYTYLRMMDPQTKNFPNFLINPMILNVSLVSIILNLNWTWMANSLQLFSMWNNLQFSKCPWSKKISMAFHITSNLKSKPYLSLLWGRWYCIHCWHMCPTNSKTKIETYMFHIGIKGPKLLWTCVGMLSVTSHNDQLTKPEHGMLVSRSSTCIRGLLENKQQ